ncbi:Polygalacturonase 1 beta-like protein 3 [Castilleja foliolosa]|uniref:Polygalacturonase 1 beta-like protein 3 n=1 Tax=Castilleja foliolosa TaxID=1961234 RepID=A0ABD3CHA3_9LAMI
MDRTRVKFNNITVFSINFLFLLSCFTVHSLADEHANTKENPFTPKASLIRYWNNHISNKNPHSAFLLSKASPLSPRDSSFFVKLASEKTLSSHLSAFCSSADLFCLVGSKPVLDNHKSDSNFAAYTNKQFSNYGNARLGGTDEFKNYSNGVNFASSSFARYSRGSNAHTEGFASYASDGNVASSNFSSYAGAATGGSGDFKGYMARVNVPDLRFSSYVTDGNGHKLAFASYSDDTNSGNQAFVGYARNANSAPVGFTSYAGTSNVVGSGFNGYGFSGNAANDSFKGYSANANNPSNTFRNYGGGGNSGVDTFTSYRDSANAGSDTFQSYGRSSSSTKTNFANYGKSFNAGLDTFKEYAKGAMGHTVGFKIYGLKNTFKEYAQKKGVSFAQYAKPGDDSSRIGVKNRVVEQGKFFRESMLKEGTITKMPNIRDWMPKRSFLPRSIMSRLPFSSDEIVELKRTFRAEDNSTMEHVLVNALTECEREPSPGETKRCVGSAEDMIDFVVSVMGRDVVVRTTEGVEGSGREVVIGKVKGVNGGRVTKAVSCHQSLYPYLLYYCHSVPKVRVYLADILDVESKERINHGVAICHVDTSAWSPSHAAFVALGSSPGLIEVCHWIFENDMTWTSAD